MTAAEKRKLKIIITSVFALVFIAIVGKEYPDKKRSDRRIKKVIYCVTNLVGLISTV